MSLICWLEKVQVGAGEMKWLVYRAIVLANRLPLSLRESLKLAPSLTFLDYWSKLLSTLISDMASSNPLVSLREPFNGCHLWLALLIRDKLSRRCLDYKLCSHLPAWNSNQPILEPSFQKNLLTNSFLNSKVSSVSLPKILVALNSSHSDAVLNHSNAPESIGY